MLTVTRIVILTFLSWLAVVTVSFFVLRLVPGDPVDIYINQMNINASGDVKALYRAAWGLDRSAVQQYGIWLAGFLTLNWGDSFVSGKPVLSILAAGLRWSAAIGITGFALALIAGFCLGYAAALRPRRIADRLSRALAIGGQSLPAFAVGLILLWVLAVKLQIIRPFSGGNVENLLLPILLVAFFSTGSISRITRAAFNEVAVAPYMRTALAKGHSQSSALWFHGRRHAVIVLMAGIAPDLAWIVGGTAVSEVVFAVPGLSERLIAAVTTRDYPVLQSYLAIIAFWIVIGLQLAGALRRHLDPRLREAL